MICRRFHRNENQSMPRTRYNPIQEAIAVADHSVRSLERAIRLSGIRPNADHLKQVTYLLETCTEIRDIVDAMVQGQWGNPFVLPSVLTDELVRLIVPPSPEEDEVVVWDKQVPAFGVRVRASGATSFFVMYRNRINLQRRYTIGKFGVWTTEEAREEAKAILLAVGRGEDPQADKVQQRRVGKRSRRPTVYS
jgi:Arm DNA-binding domain